MVVNGDIIDKLACGKRWGGSIFNGQGILNFCLEGFFDVSVASF